MKKILLGFILIFLMPICTFAQNIQEVVYLKNGSVIKGIVIEQVPGESLKIQTKDGSVFAYKMTEVERITKELLKESGYFSTKAMISAGYKGFVDFGYIFDLDNCRADRLELTTSHGYQFNPYFYLGAGVGIDYYTDASLFAVPIFANIRITPLKRRVTPYIDAKIGYSTIDVEGLYFTPTVGCRIGLSESAGLNIGLGYSLQQSDVLYYYYDYGYSSVSKEISGFSLKIGLDF